MVMTIEVIHDSNQLYTRALTIFEEQLKQGATTFGLATGGTMLPLYEKMCASTIDFSACTSFNLDEYVGLPATHAQSYVSFMRLNLFHVKPFEESYLPDGQVRDAVAEAHAYEKKLQSKVVDFQLLGVGENGHIGFNEPGTAFDSETHVVKLTASTRQANARFFDSIEEVPTEAITMGIASILRARKILVIAVGEKKRAALTALINEEPTEDLPVTALKNHPNVHILTDIAL